MASIQGIGGVFIDSNDPKRLAEWYQTTLGLKLIGSPEDDQFYQVFFTRDYETSIVRHNPVFSIGQAKQPLTGPYRGLTLNFRVDALHPFLDQLRAQGVVVEDEIIEWELGKHAWIHDADGNRLELYEEIPQPSPSV